MTTAPGWQGILDDGEEILWQGQPEARIRVTPRNLRDSAFGLFFALFGLFWTIGALASGGLFGLFGLFFVGMGAWKAAKPAILPAYIRARTWYTLTDRRAVIATDVAVQGKRLTTRPILPETQIEYQASAPPSIWFGAPGVADRVGFEYIDDADKVLALIRGIQRPQAAPPPLPGESGPDFGSLWKDKA